MESLSLFSKHLTIRKGICRDNKKLVRELLTSTETLWNVKRVTWFSLSGTLSGSNG